MTFDSIINNLPESSGVWLFMPVASLVVFWLARGLARRCGFVDRGDGNLKLQSEPVALLGGIGVLLVWLLGAVLFADSTAQLSTSLLVAAVAITALGAVDDLFALSARVKLAGQLLICGCYFGFGDRIDYAAMTELPAMSWLIDVIGSSDALANVFVFACLMAASVLIINAVNLLDGMDGTLSVYGISVAGSLAWIGPDSLSMAVICIALCGFLVFNHPPATMYLGDAGSLLVGFLLFDALLQSLTVHSGGMASQTGTVVSLLVLLTVPVCDTALAIFRRLAQGVGPMSGDRGHIHHRLQEREETTRAALSKWAVINLTVVAIAASCRLSGDWRFACLLPLVGCVAIRMQLLGHVEYRVVRQLAGELNRLTRNLLGRVREEYSASRLVLHAESRTIVSSQASSSQDRLSIYGGDRAEDDRAENDREEDTVPRIVCRDHHSYRLAIRFTHVLGQRKQDFGSVGKIRQLQDLSPEKFSIEEISSVDQHAQRFGTQSEPIALVIDLGPDGFESTLFVKREGRLVELQRQHISSDLDVQHDQSAWAERRAA